MSNLFEGLDTEQLSLIDEELQYMIDKLWQKPEAATTESEIQRLGNLAQLLTGYLSYSNQWAFINLQKEAGKQTKSLVRWNKLLSISTVVLAISTVVLAVTTFFRG
jgi:hypothetical protein